MITGEQWLPRTLATMGIASTRVYALPRVLMHAVERFTKCCAHFVIQFSNLLQLYVHF